MISLHRVQVALQLLVVVTGSSAPDTRTITIGSNYAHTSNQPPPPGTTLWKRDAGNTAAPSSLACLGHSKGSFGRSPTAPLIARITLAEPNGCILLVGF